MCGTAQVSPGIFGAEVTGIMNRLIGVGNKTQILWKSGVYSQLLNHLSNTLKYYLVQHQAILKMGQLRGK